MTDPQAVSSERFWSVQLLRIACTFLVVLAHYLMVGSKAGAVFAGIDIFFVVSGFLVWILTERRPVTPVAFMFNRITRIVPLYWLITLVVWLIIRRDPWITPVTPSVDHLLKSLFLIPHRNSAGHIFPVVGQGWTLVYDMYFYALFALTLWLPRSRRLTALTIGFGLLSLIGVLVRPTNVALQTYTSPAMLGFLGGVWIGEAWLTRRLPSVRWAPWLALSSVGLYATLLYRNVPYEGMGILPWALSALLALTAALSVEATGWRPRRRWLDEAGHWTYGVYLSHAMILAWVFAKTTRWPELRLPLLLACSLTAGVALWYGFERPLNRLFGRFERSHTRWRRQTLADAERPGRPRAVSRRPRGGGERLGAPLSEGPPRSAP